MTSDQSAPGYQIWAVDGVVYGPVELPTLVEWIKDERVVADTWIYQEEADSWQKASQIPDLQMFFRPRSTPSRLEVGERSQPLSGASAGCLRRVKVLADLNDQQLERFAQFMEIKGVRQWEEVMKQGEPGNAMYLLLEGEARVRLMINGKESILATLNAGEFFGEVALFDRGPRSADVITNRDSVLLKISVDNFQRLLDRAPELAAPFLFSIGKTLVARIRADNKRFQDSVHWARTAGF